MIYMRRWNAEIKPFSAKKINASTGRGGGNTPVTTALVLEESCSAKKSYELSLSRCCSGIPGIYSNNALS